MARVLVVDDSPALRAVARAILEEEGGHELFEAADGRSALALLRSSAVPLVALLDLRLADGDDAGGLLAELVADPVLGRHAYGLVSATPRERFPAEAGSLLEALDIPTLAKPFDIDDLLALVTRLAARLGR